jgi:type IV pilus assembly protein PilB
MHRFRDEWLVPLAQRSLGLQASFVDKCRSNQERYLAGALSRASLAMPEAVGKIVENAYHIHSVTPDAAAIPPEAIRLVPEKVCRNHDVLPVGAQADFLDLAMANPLDPVAQQEVQFASGRRVRPLYCHPYHLEELTDTLLNPEVSVLRLLDGLQSGAPVEMYRVAEVEVGVAEKLASPVIRLADILVANAVERRASDVHIEQEQDSTSVRYRVDGLLRKMVTLPRYLGAGPLVARFKIMANLDVSDRMRPQDGRAQLRVGDTVIGLRVSTLPTPLGEKVVIRILDEREAHRPLEAMGIRGDLLQRYQNLVNRKQGILLSTGPTGSGKTTTLHAVLRTLKSEHTNIVTVEDPIEYRLTGINQIQVNEKQGLTFASVLRSVLRQDPDVIMVGEIRDAETANISFQAAQTGHLVLSTLHTNDTVSTVVRLADMGLERFKIAAALVAVTAQRLVRTLCRSCREPLMDAGPASAASPAADLAAKFRREQSRRGIAPILWTSKGCSDCGLTGYKGRVMLFELLEITDAFKAAIGSSMNPAELRTMALNCGALHTLEDDILRHLAEGKTSLEEVAPYINLDASETAPLATAATASASATAPSASFPASPGAPAVSAAIAMPNQEAPSAAALAPEPKRILLAGADPEMAALLRGVLLQDGRYFLDEVGSAALAMRLIPVDPPDLLMIGLGRGAQDFAALRTIRAQTGTALPILALVNDVAAGKEAFASGATDVLPVTASSNFVPELVVARVEGAMLRAASFPNTRTIGQPKVPRDEPERLGALRATQLLDTPPEERFDSITRLAKTMFDVPIATITFVDADRQWFKSSIGVEGRGGPREYSFCAHAINHDAFVVEDAALDPRFSENPLVTGDPRIRAYAGATIQGPSGHKLGTICVIDTKPRDFAEQDVDKLKALARVVEDQLKKG